MKKRLNRLMETLICKSTVAWIAACGFLYLDKITGTDWCLLTGGIFITKQYFEAKKDVPSNTGG